MTSIMNIIRRPHLLSRARYIVLYNSRKLSVGANTSIIETQSGIFRAISESVPVEYLQTFLINVHDTTSLPWWATIICTTIFLRSAVTVPLALHQHYILAKIRNIQLELVDLEKELKSEVGVAVNLYKWDERTAKRQYARSMKKLWNNLIVRDNCHPVKASLLIWFQIPLWVCFSAVLRNLAYQLPITSPSAVTVFNDLSIEGFGWITNLTQADPLLILPIAFGLINLGIIEIQVLSKVTPPTRLQRYLMHFFRGIAIIMVPVAATVPSCVALYWTTSSVFGLLQNVMLMSPRLKRVCRIPKNPTDLDNPYLHIINNACPNYAIM